MVLHMLHIPACFADAALPCAPGAGRRPDASSV